MLLPLVREIGWSFAPLILLVALGDAQDTPEAHLGKGL